MLWKKRVAKKPSLGPCAARLTVEQLESREVLSTAPYVVPLAPNVTIQALLTVGDTVPQTGGGNYRMVGIPDGTGAFDNGDGTFTVLMNHELRNNAGVARDHGAVGAFVSKFIIDKATLNVLQGDDLIKEVKLFDPVLGQYFTPLTPYAISRLCSADLPAVSAFFNPATGLGTTERIFMDGEETGDEGKSFGTVVSTGIAYELPRLGKFSWENSVANPFAQNKTIVIGTDDSTPGQVYVYVGTKTNTGLDVDKAGLTNGNLFGVKVDGVTSEVRLTGLGAAVKNFTLHNLGNVSAKTGAQIQAESAAAGITNFLRPEDGHWDPNNPTDFYFVTTDQFDQVQAGTGTAIGRSRLWRLRFTNIAQPELGGSIEMLLDGTEGGQMYDNMTVDSLGRVLLQEDVGGQDHLGRLWAYDIATDSLTLLAQHNPDFFQPGVSGFLTRDEESSGIIDVSQILGPGKYLFDVQAHFTNSDPELVEGGQLLVMTINGPTADLRPDGELVILGTNRGEDIDVRLRNNGDLEVRVNGKKLATFDAADVGSITVNAYGGNDEIEIDDDLDISTFLVGGDGNDEIEGGGGSDLILGGRGNDEIEGRDGRDVLIGGLGRDEIEGGKGDDLLIGGFTIYDNDAVALAKIRDAWIAPLSYNTRITNLRIGAGGVPKLDVTTVIDDQVKDELKGGDGLDWFWAGVLDKVKMKPFEEFGPPAP